MSVTIKPKRTATGGYVPTLSDLVDGEFCINTTDKIVYMRSGSSIIAVANYSTGGGGGSQEVFVQQTQPALVAGQPFIWVQIDALGNEIDEWIFDGVIE